MDAADAAERRRVAEVLNAQAMRLMAYVPLGYYWQPSVWRRSLSGVFRAQATVFWGIEKTG